MPGGAGACAVPWARPASWAGRPAARRSCASRSASSSRSVSWNIWRCSAVIASLLAPNFQRLSRASSKLTFSSFASRQAMSRSLRSISFCLSFELVALVLEFPGLLPDVLEHLRGQRRHGLGRQTLQVLSLEIAHVEHASHLATCNELTPPAELLSTHARRSRDAHTRVITLISGRRCQGRPTTKASNCALVNDSGVSRRLARPREVTSVQTPRGTPHAEPVVDQQLDARGARVGEEVAVVSVGSAGGLHNAAQKSLDPGAHVHRRGAQPEPIDADHLSRPEVSSRSQAVHSSPAAVGQRTLKCSGPRRRSTRMNGPPLGNAPAGSAATLVAVLADADISIATNSGWAPSSGEVVDRVPRRLARRRPDRHAGELGSAPGAPLAHEIGVQTMRQRDPRD